MGLNYRVWFDTRDGAWIAELVEYDLNAAGTTEEAAGVALAKTIACAYAVAHEKGIEVTEVLCKK